MLEIVDAICTNRTLLVKVEAVGKCKVVTEGGGVATNTVLNIVVNMISMPRKEIIRDKPSVY